MVSSLSTIDWLLEMALSEASDNSDLRPTIDHRFFV